MQSKKIAFLFVVVFLVTNLPLSHGQGTRKTSQKILASNPTAGSKNSSSSSETEKTGNSLFLVQKECASKTWNRTYANSPPKEQSAYPINTLPKLSAAESVRFSERIAVPAKRSSVIFAVPKMVADEEEERGQRTEDRGQEEQPVVVEQVVVAEEPVAVEQAVVAEVPVTEEPEDEAQPIVEESQKQQPEALASGFEERGQRTEDGGQEEQTVVVEHPVAVEEQVAEVPVAVEEPEDEPQPIVEEPVAEEPVVEQPVVEEPAAEEPAADEEPVAVEPVAEGPPVAVGPPLAEGEEKEQEELPVVVEEPKSEPKVEVSVATAPDREHVPLISPTPAPEGNVSKLLRYPDVHRYNVVFCYGGDLWTVKTKGGLATRLTAHEGQELFPKYSPNGKMIAFTGQYDGDEQVYVIPSEGGNPRQLTYYPAQGPFPPRRGYDNIVYGWTPDGKSVLFRSLRDSNGVTELGALYKVSLEGGLPERLPMPTAGAGDYSPDGKRIVYAPLFRDFRSWKRYEGGWAQDLAIFDLKTHACKKIAVSPRTERDPMWVRRTEDGKVKNEIYFVSDRDTTLNLFKYDVETGKVDQITRSTTWDVRWASSDGRSKIVYELGGELRLYNIENGETRDIPVQVPHDGLSMRPSRYNVSGNIESFALAPGGKRAAIIARGDLFTVPAEKGAARNLTQSSGAHDREAAWSADGSKIAFISDASGEDQLYLVDQKGETPPERLTDSFERMLSGTDWSPDGRFLAVADCDHRLYIVPTADFEEFKKGIPLEVARDTNGGSLEFAWSPCSRFLALTLDNATGFSSLYIWELKTRQLHRITGPNNNEFSPSWDPAGKYLYYLARHEYAPQISSLEWNFAGNRNIGIYALALRKDVPNPFGPQSDEVEEKRTGDGGQRTGEGEQGAVAEGKGEEKKDSEKNGKENAEGNSKPVQETVIEFEGLAERVVRIPVGFENYQQLRATKQFLFYVQSGAPFYGRDSYETPSIRVFDLKERKESKLAENVAGTFALSPDGSKILFSSANQLKIANANAAAQTPSVLPTADLAVDRVPAEEWEEIFNETCRKFRDYFYVKNMHGYDWKAICDQYRSLLPYVAHRSDLNYVIAEMISELNVGHAYVQGGDFTIPERPKAGLPGARFELDAESNRSKIAKIFKGQNQEPKYRSPLTEIGVDIAPGDYVLEIDGKELLGSDNPYRLLQNKTNPVCLTVNDKPNLEGSRKVVYQPIESEASLLYLDFVTDRIDRVAKATDNRIGYMHLPDMSAPGAYEFIKWYYPQVRKEGMVIDVRSNGGGNISQWVIMRLSQKLLGTRFGSTRETPSTYPYTVFNGQLVCLINETSASDGDIFPYYFRKAGLGPLIGKRSWGGVVGISSVGALIDGGQVMVPLNATNDENGEYIIEGEGVTPDIEVENDPKSMLEGRDLQLERGIEEVLRKLELEPKSLPAHRPNDPIKTKEAVKKY